MAKKTAIKSLMSGQKQQRLYNQRIAQVTATFFGLQRIRNSSMRDHH